MRPIDLPIGAIVVLGPHGSATLAVKIIGGRWRMLHNGELVDPTVFRRPWSLYVPQFPAEVKVRYVESFGFLPSRPKHESDCQYAHDPERGCTCIQPESVWHQPADVATHRQESLSERLAVPAEQRLLHDVDRW